MNLARCRALGPALAALAVLAGAQSKAEPQSAAVTAYPAAYFATMGTTTAYDMVLRLPGFAFDDGSAVRGFAGAAGNVLIDGERPTSKADDLVSILKRIPAAQVARIDVIRGAAPGVDMQGKTVVANVILKSAAGFSGVAGLANFLTGQGYDDPQGRLDGTWKLGQGRTIEAGIDISKFHDNTQGPGSHRILGPGGALLDTSAMQNHAPGWQNTATGAFETPLLGGKFRANLLLEDQPYGLVNDDDFRLAGRQSLTTRQDQQDAELGLHYERPLATVLTLETLALQHLNRLGVDSAFATPTDSQVFALRDQGGESIGRAVLHWRPTPKLTVDAGGEFAYNWVKTRTGFSDNGAPVAIPAANVRVDERRGEAFATATWLPFSGLSVEAGVRVERSTIASRGDVTLSRTLSFPKPRIALTWSPDASNQLRLRIEREVGQLDFKSFAASASLNANGVVAGNPNLSPQRDWAFEAAYERHFWKDGVVSVTLRHLILEDVIDSAPVFAPSGTFDEPGNIGGGREDDVVATFNLPLDRLGLAEASLRGQGTWRIAEVTDPTTHSRRPISGQHPVDAELHFNQGLPRWKLNWGADVTFGVVERYFRFDEIDSNVSGAFADVFVEYQARPDLQLHLELDDAFDYDIRRQVFAGPRNTNPFLLTDLQRHRFGPVFFARLRKTFG